MLDSTSLDEFWDLLIDRLVEWPDELDLPTKQPNGEALLVMVPDLKEAYEKLDEVSAKLALNTMTGAMKQFGAVVKVETRQQALEAFTKIVASRRPKKKEVKRKAKKVTDGIKGKVIGEIYDRICYYDAVLDLLTGQLHRLDPVIGDAGCQWRVPFVLDFYDFMSRSVVEKFGGLEAIQPSFERYSEFRSRWSCRTILVELQKAKTKGSDSYEISESDLWSYVSEFDANLRKNCGDYLKIVEVFELAIENFKKHRELDIDFKKFLTLCKLFTTNRVRQMDVFGLSGIQMELSLPHPNKDLRIYVETLGEFSVKYMRRVVDLVVDFEADEFEGLGFEDVPVSVATAELLKSENLFRTSQQGTTYNTHVFYGPFRSLFVYQWHLDQPIIIDLRRLVARAKPDDPENVTYEYNDGAILYFEPGKGGFTYVENPKPEQVSRVGMCVECYSVYRADLPMNVGDEDQAFFTPDFSKYLSHLINNCSIVDLLLCAASTHAELPMPIRGDDGFYPPDQLHQLVENRYAKPLKQVHSNLGKHYLGTTTWQLTGCPIQLLGAKSPEWDLIAEQRLMRKVMREKFRLETTAYKEYLPGDEHHANRSRALRIANHVPFAPIHIYGCSYAIKRRELDQFEEKLAKEKIVTGRLIDNSNCKPKDD